MKVLVFGGTTEGRRLCEALSGAGIDVTLSVATEFGREMAENAGVGVGAAILSERLGAAEMTALLSQQGQSGQQNQQGANSYDAVVDATHPYAVEVTKNIRSACLAAGINYYRLKRPESAEVAGITYVPDMSAAVEILNKSDDDKILLTTGSKELEPFTHVKNFAERIFVRILPMQNSLQKALGLGFRGSNIICMQGPFDKEMNVATLKMTGAKYMVTKDSGDAGGFFDKVSAALSIGCETIVIARPVREEGYTFDELLELFHIECADSAASVRYIKRTNSTSGAGSSDSAASAYNSKSTAYFPLFVDMREKKALVIGGGNVAERRVKILASFGADITVISPEASESIARLASCFIKRKYQTGDIAAIDPYLVITATDDRQTNHAAMFEAKNLDILISVADRREECTFYFPAIVENDNYIAGLVSKNGDHSGVKRTAEKLRGLL